MRPKASWWALAAEFGTVVDLTSLVCLGGVSYLLFQHSGRFRPLEGTVLMMATGVLIQAGRRLWERQEKLLQEGRLGDWVQRILRGERVMATEPSAMPESDRLPALALNAVIQDGQEARLELENMKEAVTREWRGLDALLEELQRYQASEAEAKILGASRLEALGRDLKQVLERSLNLNQIELNQRLRADQHRLQGQVFRASLQQVHVILDQYENLLEELQDTFPKLRREEDALSRLADAGLRQGAQLSLAVKNLMAHTPRLMEETQNRMEGLQRFRHSADDFRDQAEALNRRIERFREETQGRIRSFSGAQMATRGLSQLAQQTGLLAVNTAILAQQGGGEGGMTEIGGRLRSLADRTTESTSELERMLDHHQRGLDHELSGLWELQEVAERLILGVHDLLRMAGHLDQQGHDLERALETHFGLVDQAQQAAERAELSLHEVGERAQALESAHGRQWGVEAKLAPERERLVRVATHVAKVGDELAQISQQNLDDLWNVLARHQDLQRSEAYREMTSGGLTRLLVSRGGSQPAWSRILWIRSQRRHRLAKAPESLPYGRRDSSGRIHLLILGLDAIQCPEPSALESWVCDDSGKNWNLRLQDFLRSEGHVLALLGLLKESPLPACLPGMDIRVSSEGVDIRLPHPYPGFPWFLAGLGLELPLDGGQQDQRFREAGPRENPVQRLLWVGPAEGEGLQNPCLRMVHGWIRDHSQHESFLPWLPYPGPRPACPIPEDHEVEVSLEDKPSFRCLGLGADLGGLHPVRERLIQAGAIEGAGNVVLCAVGIGHPHPETLLLRLFQEGAGMAGDSHPELAPYQARFREEVLGGATGDPYHAAWSMIEDLQREGWMLPLPPAWS